MAAFTFTFYLSDINQVKQVCCHFQNQNHVFWPGMCVSIHKEFDGVSQA